MATFKFHNFTFNSKTLGLTKQGTNVHIRPKAAQLLNVLIENRDRVMSKSDIIEAVWQSNGVQDHTIFQLISDVRKLSTSDLVLTLPNQGYRWVAPTREISSAPKWAPLLAAACAVFLLGSAALAHQYRDRPSDSYTVSLLPAVNALYKGAAALEKGDSDVAIDWFSFALEENPGSEEARLLLAESLFMKNQLDDADLHLNQIINDANVSPYTLTAASDLMSRIRQKQGRLYDALNFAQQSAQNFQSADSLPYCSVNLVEERIVTLKSALGISEDKHDDKTRRTTLSSKNYDDRCKEVKEARSADDVSACIPLNGEFQSLLHPQRHVS